MTEVSIVNGAPRYHHKTTKLLGDVVDSGDRGLYIVPNHSLGEELCTNHLSNPWDPQNEQYGQDQRKIVQVKGKRKSCPDCDHDYGKREKYQARDSAIKALKQHPVITADLFEGDVCPYYACLEAAAMAKHVVTVPEMLYVLDLDWSEFRVVIDEESTMMRFFPRDSKILELSYTESDFDETPISISDQPILRKNIKNIREQVEQKINSLDRVPCEYRNVKKAVSSLQKLFDRISEKNVEGAESLSEASERLKSIQIPSLSIETKSQKTFEYIRRDLQFYKANEPVEAMLANPKIYTERSQGTLNCYLIPDPESDLMAHREVFEDSIHVHTVGAVIADYFCSKISTDEIGSENTEQLGKVQTENLDLFVIESDDEFQRREFIQNVAKHLLEQGLHTLVICGSKSRASEVYEALHPRSYEFHSDSTESEYSHIAEDDWNITSYLGSTITRGVDVDTQITLVRSDQFSAPRWNYYDNNLYRWIKDYEMLIESHNAMLRGAGQGEHHVAIIPPLSSMFFHLQQYVTPFNVDEHDPKDVANAALDALELNGTKRCQYCDRIFLDQHGFEMHECE